MLSCQFIEPRNWKPSGIEALEQNAMDVVFSALHSAVVAGPGSGKTELLAQRAAFLLQTGAAPSPQRILAISFKRDAAKNLSTRIQLRCHPSHAARFDSLTFDAFAKGLLDRFGQSLPEHWRPRANYEIFFPNSRMYEGFLRQLESPPSSIGERADIMALKTDSFERQYLIGQPLPIDNWIDPTPGEWASSEFWHSALHAGRKSYLSFPMIGRLAELLFRLNKSARDALRLTYSHIFMDEFQDTTQVQYDLVRTIFLGSKAIITAVGDTKQQIMRWANAMEDPFSILEGDFGARRIKLSNNYRSSKKLVQFQHVMAQELDSSVGLSESQRTGTVDGKVCSVWIFSNKQLETEKIAEFVAREIEINGLNPRDIALLVRQKASEFEKRLKPAFFCRGLEILNEAASLGSVTLQDLFTEEASIILILLLRVVSTTRAGMKWCDCVQLLAVLRRLDLNDEVVYRRMIRQIDQFVQNFLSNYPNPPNDLEEAKEVVKFVQDFVGRECLVAANPAYRQGDWLDKVTEASAIHLKDSAVNSENWSQTLNSYEGHHAVPLMTIHKSKGLEFHTVILVGLDDNAWWSFKNDPVEGTAGFFVAFSRAKQRVFFTYCEQGSSRDKIAPLYDLLESAGIDSIKFG